MAGGSAPAADRWPFLVILGLHALAVLLFTRGFLLTRTELSSYSRCSDLHLSPCFPADPTTTTATSSSSPQNATPAEDPQSDGGGGGKCWTRPAVDRLVIIVLDALRFDFVAPSTFFKESKPWMDKLRVLQKLASSEGSSARIFKAIADPPTTSLQRLKGLTTGGLPTFIDVGNSFGAPAIIEDNLLARNGKRVLMMGDDTWLQLFPDLFDMAYPYPSFNVKDLHTVDDGCVEHLLPSLYREDWDVLIAHFLGVDHAGHIFGVDSIPMIEKLEQYNRILEEVVEVLKNQSGPGGLHEKTFLIVMGDHGQTTNGDHGGGTAEEVETSLFAMSLKNPPAPASSVLDAGSCKLDLDGEKICVGSLQQLDFAVTITALLGVPFPFGSIGRVNPEMYALSAGTWDIESTSAVSHKPLSSLEAWMWNYVKALCVNCWQVKRYIDMYSATSVIGFPSEDLQHVEEMYSQAQANWSNTIKNTCLSENVSMNESQSGSISVLEGQIQLYSNFLKSVADLARSKWTEFDLKMMAAGLGVMLVSLHFHLFAMMRANKLYQTYCSPTSNYMISSRLMIGLFLVALRAVSFLSNSYILAEGKVASFLLATSVIINLQYSIVNGDIGLKEITFLLLIIILRFKIEFGLSKETVGSTSLITHSLSFLGIKEGNLVWMVFFEVLPAIVLIFLAFLLYKSTAGTSCWRSSKFFIIGTIFSYMLIAIHWTSESSLITVPTVVLSIGRNFIPRVIYAIGIGLIVLLVPVQVFKWKERASDHNDRTVIATVSMLCALSSSILILLGKQGPSAGLVSVVGAWCMCRHNIKGVVQNILMDPIPVTQWSFLAVCLFFYTGHWCAFDGLRYGAAFIGFEHFNIIRQGILLAIDTFSVSHILPIFGLPFLVAFQDQHRKSKQGNAIFFLSLTQVFLSYGFIASVTTTLTIICVAIQRRHLMVWGLFAPKYVFDVVGLILTDILIFLASLYYI